MTDHHISKNRSRQREQNTESPKKQSSSTTTLPDNQLAVSEGDSLTLGRKRSLISAEDNVVTGAQDAQHKGQVGDVAAAVSTQSTPQTVDELKLPPRINLLESGLRRSERIKALNVNKTPTEHKPSHVQYGAKPLTNGIIGLFTLFLFANDMSVPHHKIDSDAPMKDKMIAKFEELNELFDGTLNQFHMLAFSTDISSNEVFTFREAMKQEDKLDFVQAMEKEIEDHQSRDHWSIVERSSLPDTAKPIRAIWSFKRKRRPDGTLLKHKARLCAHGGMQTWGTNYWETYSPVVNMITVRLILLIARIYNLDSKAIDFVLAFPQADLDVDIWMYLPSGFQIDGATEEESSRKYILKLNKSLYGLKQASFNWYEKLKSGLLVRGFTQSKIDPCLYFKKGMLIITYVDDCIIVAKSMVDINTFVESMKNGSEEFILTDEGNINKFLGIDIKQVTKNKFELSQPFLTERIVKLLGLENNKFGIDCNTKVTPVGKPLLNKDLAGKPRKLTWKYRTAIGMLTYLQNNSRPEISMAVHQLARFCNDPKLCHEQATMRLGKYLAHTKDRGIIYDPDKSMGLECYVDADFAGGWNCQSTDDADNVMSRTGFVIMYANCPIYWASRLQTEIALSTAEAEYIALSSALREVIPLMTLMKDLQITFPVHITKPTFHCKVHEDNQSCITMAKSEKFTPRTKHIALKYHHFRSYVKKGAIEIDYCRTEDQKADLLTKPLSDALFFRLRYMLVGW